MKKIILTSLLVFFPACIFSQAYLQWSSFYSGLSGISYDNPRSIAVSDSGNVYVTGVSGVSQDDYATVKYNSSGVEKWVARYDGPSGFTDDAYAIAVDKSGNVYVTGESTGSGTGLDYATIKYSPSGVQLWIKRYNGAANLDDNARAIAVDDSGNVYVTGASSVSSSNYNCTTIKYSPDGVQKWVAIFNGIPSTYVNVALAIDGAHNVYITGYATIKYNTSGTQLWATTNEGTTFARTISLDASGNVYVAGGTKLIKYNSTGTKQFSYTLTFGGYALKVDNSGNACVTGTNASTDVITEKISSAGNQLWIKSFNGTGNSVDVGEFINVDNANNVYVAGRTTGSGSGNDFVVLKYNSSGVQQWVQTYNRSNGSDITFGLALDNNANIYLTGRTYSGTSDYDYTTLKYTQSVGIRNIGMGIPASFALNQNFPNPFNSNSVIRFSIPAACEVILRIFDASGKAVNTLVNQRLSPGYYETSFEGVNLPSGVYFYNLSAGNYSQTRKMIMTK